jgi:S-DNA-T family DNA segregation ATPase FtsK/SpoIIIE
MYYVGPGVFLLLIAVSGLLVVRLWQGSITQPVLRGLGLALLVASASSSWYLVWPVARFWPYGGGGFAFGNGGVLGVGMGTFLRAHFAVLGTSIVVVGGWAVGAVLLADSVVLALARWFGHVISRIFGLASPAWSAAKKRSQALGEIWSRLSEKQQQESSAPAVLSRRLGRRQRTFIDQGEPAVEQEPAAGRKEKRAQPIAVATDEEKGYVPASYEEYELPPLELLKTPAYGFAAVQEKMVDRKAEALEKLLGEFGVNAHVVNAEPGPAITMYELELSAGIKVSQISNLANDMARALGAGSVRVVAPLAGRHTIGIEVPNSQREIVRIKDLLQKSDSVARRMYIPLFLGKSSSGEVLVTDLASMPHLLIAGTTGSGKSVCINGIITSVLMTKRPDEVKMILVDPKMVEMAIFDMIPHLMCPIITDTSRAEQILEWATTKMDERYELLAEAKVRNIASYNKLGAQEIINRFKPTTAEEEAKIPKTIPHILIVIDELADLMMTSAKEIEAYIVRLAQKSRAVGIHLVVATQRPQATVVTGLIKSNMPSRIAFRVASRMDSRIILDQNGGETLLGQGDMLFLKPGTSDLVRAQGAYCDDQEIKKVVKYLREVAEPQFHPELMQLNRVDVASMSKDDLFDDAVRVVLESKRGSVSLLQRRLSVGYARASRMIEVMAVSGILGEYKGSQAREVLLTLKEYEKAKKQMTADAAAGFSDLNEDDQGQEEYAGVVEAGGETGDEPAAAGEGDDF